MTAVDVLRVEWTTAGDGTVATLIGPVDRHGTDVLVGVGVVAWGAPRLIVDLARVESATEEGITLLEALSRLPNVGIVNVVPAVQDALAKLGRLGL
jgi:hypothetical protein